MNRAEVIMDIVRLYAGLQQKAEAQMDAAELSITMRQMEILDCVKRDMHVHDISRALGISQSAITQQLNKLEEMGMVKKYPDPRDARVALLRVTQKGTKAYNERGEHALEVAVEVLLPLADKELIQYRAMLVKVNTSFNVTDLPFSQ
jgi:DNA-binding MarR family transcriptional regulator